MAKTEVEAVETVPAQTIVLSSRNSERMMKVLLTLREDAFRTIVFEARRRGITVQELLRAVIIPDWVQDNVPRRVRTISSDDKLALRWDTRP